MGRWVGRLVGRWVGGWMGGCPGGRAGGRVGGHYTNQMINISRCQILEFAHRTGVNVSLIMG